MSLHSLQSFSFFPIFSVFKFVLLRFCFFLFCFFFVFSEVIPVYFLFNLIFENLILHIFRIIVIIIPRSGMFRNIPYSWFYWRPFKAATEQLKCTFANWCLLNVFIQPGTRCNHCFIYNYYTSDSLWKIWLVESIQSIHNSLWTWLDKCNICCRHCIYHVKFNVCLVTKPLGVFSSEIK